MANQKFYEAVLRDSLPISREYAEKGWPPLLYPFFLALVQMPDADRPAQKAFTLHMGDSIRAGALPAVRQRIPWAINEVIEPHVTAQDFAAWLASEGVTPSPLVAEWFKHQGVASPAPAPAQHAAAPAAAPVAGSASSAPGNARRDLLVPVIEAAQRECEDPFDPPAVWAALSQMAQAGKRPLVGVTEEGIKWNDAEDNPQFFTIASLRDRLRRIKKKAPQSAIRRANTR